ncbi:hypothetical protein ACE1SV_63400 [Streptomyces sennicomposti]
MSRAPDTIRGLMVKQSWAAAILHGDKLMGTGPGRGRRAGTCCTQEQARTGPRCVTRSWPTRSEGTSWPARAVLGAVRVTGSHTDSRMGKPGCLFLRNARPIRASRTRGS